MSKKKTGAQLRKEIESYLYWPGGEGGGGARRGSPTRSAVVRPHARTSPRCTKCSQFHTTADHERHAGSDAPVRAPNRAGSATKAKAKPAKPRISKPVSKPTRSTRPNVPKAPKVAATEQDRIDIVREVVRKAPRADRFSDGVYVSSVWSKVKSRLHIPSLDQFKNWLVSKNAEQAITLSRIDLVDMADPKKTEESAIHSYGALFDLIRDDDRYASSEMEFGRRFADD